MKKYELYRHERDNGLTHSQIAKKYGISRQRVAQVCGKYTPTSFIAITEEQCVYPKWRAWMNDNKVSRAELIRRMGNVASEKSFERLSSYMRGVNHPTKATIDKLLAATGLTYEELFWRP